jgi:2-C-methyl-D-erythritol 4-phosphate cytidylyltransferase
MLEFRMANFHVLIPAAGSGSRMGSDVPKQYLQLLGLPLIAHCIDTFIQNPRIAGVHVVISADDGDWQRQPISAGPGLFVHPCGGETRADSVLNGLAAMKDVADDDWVLVHDAARPGLTQALLDRLLDAVQEDAVGGLLAIPLADTLKRADSTQRVAATEPRAGLWQAQTPQMFRYGLLKKALQNAGATPTDEAQAVEALGLKPLLVPGELRNLKITYPQDLALAEAILMADRNKKEEGR